MPIDRGRHRAEPASPRDPGAPERWCSPTPDEAARTFAPLGVPWWIAGGWAIELFTGESREHADLDVGCFRADVPAVLEALDGWEIRGAVDEELVLVHRGASLPRTVKNLWCRPRGSDSWVIEILLEEREGADWVYRRDPRIRRSADDILDRTRAGLPFLRPEIQLLYKSKDPRARDERDFAAAWSRLSSNARRWLTRALTSVSAVHPWVDDI
jgi:hypothetical protein